MSMQRKKVLVIGSGGRLGGLLLEKLSSRHDATGFDRKAMDLGSPEEIRALLEPLDFDFAIITGALTAVDHCETHRDEAFAVNATGPGEIARIAAEKGAHVTYISTDFVFDGGKEEPYLETDPVNPVSVYGASKLAGEEAVLGVSTDHLVIRVSWVYGPGRPAFPEWIVGKACQEASLSLPEDKVGCPTNTNDLVAAIEALVFDPEGTASGIYHFCNAQPCTWREWGEACLEFAAASGVPVRTTAISPSTLDSIAAFVARRPARSAMDTTKFTARTGIQPRPWRTALRDFVVHGGSFDVYKLSSKES